jgi:hypothetical protein
MLHALLESRKLFDLSGLPVADYDFGLAFDDGGYQIRDSAAWILVVTVGVDQYVGSMLQCVIYSVAEGSGQTSGRGMSDDMLHAQFFGDFNSTVGASVINDHDFDLIYARDGLRKVFEHQGRVVSSFKQGICMNNRIVAPLLDCGRIYIPMILHQYM